MDYLKLVEFLARGRGIHKVCFFCSESGNEKEEDFHAFLRRHGVRVISRPLRKVDGERREKGVDVVGSLSYDPDLFLSSLEGRPLRAGRAAKDIEKILDILTEGNDG